MVLPLQGRSHRFKSCSAHKGFILCWSSSPCLWEITKNYWRIIFTS